MASVYIGWIEIPPAIAVKIRTKHSITPDEVRDACSGHFSARWHVHPVHGRRLLVRGRTGSGREVKMILHPVDERDGTWRLATALASS